MDSLSSYQRSLAIAAATAGLHVGDRVLAVNGTGVKVMQADGTPLRRTRWRRLIRASLQEVKLVGVAPPSRSTSGGRRRAAREVASARATAAWLDGRGDHGCDATGPAHSAGLRNGDLLVSSMASSSATNATASRCSPRPRESTRVVAAATTDDSDEKASLASSKAPSATTAGSTHNRDPQAASGAGVVVAVGTVHTRITCTASTAACQPCLPTCRIRTHKRRESLVSIL